MAADRPRRSGRLYLPRRVIRLEEVVDDIIDIVQLVLLKRSTYTQGEPQAQAPFS